MESTTNYELFSKHHNNRELNETNVLMIMKSIQIKNLLMYKPILCNKNLEVIDGQHRLEAARRLGVAIFYEVDRNIKTQDMILLNNNSKTWAKEDYLNYYCADKKQDYLKLKNFMKLTGLNLSLSLTILGKSGGKAGKEFKLGNFIYPSSSEEIHSHQVLEQSNKIIDYIKPKLDHNPHYINGSAFRRSLYLFLSIRAVDFEYFMNKIQIRLDLIRPCARIVDFVSIFKQIYNWKNKSPISLNDDELSIV